MHMPRHSCTTAKCFCSCIKVMLFLRSTFPMLERSEFALGAAFQFTEGHFSTGGQRVGGSFLLPVKPRGAIGYFVGITTGASKVIPAGTPPRTSWSSGCGPPTTATQGGGSPPIRGWHCQAGRGGHSTAASPRQDRDGHPGLQVFLVGGAVHEEGHPGAEGRL
jgi:hypothetical protein